MVKLIWKVLLFVACIERDNGNNLEALCSTSALFRFTLL
jgi:hypothetical protein